MAFTIQISFKVYKICHSNDAKCECGASILRCKGNTVCRRCGEQGIPPWTLESNVYDAAKARYDEVVEAIAEKAAQSKRLLEFIRTMKMQESILTGFDEQLWRSMAEFVTVGRAKEIVVTFRDGTEMKV